MEFKDKVVIITGAGSGFGAAAVRKFVDEGANVIAADINEGSLVDIVESVAAAPGTTVAVTTDVTNRNAVQNMVDTAVKQFGTVDVLINNAGGGHPPQFLHEMSEEQYDFIFNLNTKSVFYGVQCAVPVMTENGGGVILNTASIGAKSPRPKSAAYNSAKGAVVVMTRALAVELARFKIRVNCLCPVASETDFFKSVTGQDAMTDEQRKFFTSDIPLRRMTDPDDVANAMVYLASDKASFLTGISLDIDGGKSI